MKNRIILAALLAGICVLAGCSLKKPVPESTVAESTAPTETETEETETEPPTVEEFPHTSEETSAGPPEEVNNSGCRIVIASDMHYLARDLTDFQTGFTYDVEHGDGKVMQYIWEITDAFVDEVKNERPDLVILSGDLTLEGEKASHIEFAGKLEEIEEAGIPVVVIPGNHDVNNPLAARFSGDSKLKTENISPEEFEEIYQDFGYSEAVSRDPASLSYVYQINDYTRAMMLDTCQYEPRNLVGGMIKDDTYDWIEEQMEEAWNLGMNVIPVGHHNLLDESEVYLQDCTIEHSEQLIDQLESWDVPLFLSGHLHVQHYMRSNDDSGIYEIVTSSLSTPPCQYGILFYGDDGSFRYHTRSLDMKSWAQNTGSTDSNLLNFDEFGKKFLSKVFYNQAQDEFKRLDTFRDLTKYQKDQMAKVNAELNAACYAGKVVEIREKAMAKPGYKMWEEEGYPSILAQYLEWITADGTKDYNVLNAE
ncbi:metallophosphoesterase [Lachnospiraceae bacterium 54-53]